MHAILEIVAALMVITSAAQGSPGAPEPSPVIAGESCTAAFVIGPEDVLELAVWGSPEVTRTVPVRPDGKISLPLVNDIQASGLTPIQLREAVTKALKPYIPEPAVSVLVREIHSFKVTVIGQVKTPGRYELKGRATVLDVLAMAGGLNEYADRGRIVVLREEEGTPRQIPFAYDKLTSKNASKPGGPENLCVRPGDVILVP
jgi:polysaccharide export outer membrane protein